MVISNSLKQLIQVSESVLFVLSYAWGNRQKRKNSILQMENLQNGERYVQG